VQLAEQIKRAIAVGALAPGERLPTVKGLAHDLKLNANTVARVYRDLEREGVIATAAGRGSFVREDGALGGSPTTLRPPPSTVPCARRAHSASPCTSCARSSTHRSSSATPKITKRRT